MARLADDAYGKAEVRVLKLERGAERPHDLAT